MANQGLEIMDKVKKQRPVGMKNSSVIGLDWAHALFFRNKVKKPKIEKRKRTI
jgi:hypothetical protein